MGKIGYGYGSEWHLLRYLGYHRTYLSKKILEITGGDSIDWLDFNFSNTNKPLQDDKELCGLDFIKNKDVQEQWKGFWPQRGTGQNWDAVGNIFYENKNQHDRLLIEAKGHLGEIESSCGAKSQRSKDKILTAFRRASQAFGNQDNPVENWLKPYYQFANRLAVLYFLMNECDPPVTTRLLFIYFCGEKRERLECPETDQEWYLAIDAMKTHLGIDNTCGLLKRVHYLFLPVNPYAEGDRLTTKQ
ncbi:MAG: hypothetical protein D3922_11160 [Candidatus Electrothrix sp. AR1]|nr:hypothetical protein [Candidatus Electrothrix sp. AR1]